MDIFILQSRLTCPLEMLEMSISLELAIDVDEVITLNMTQGPCMLLLRVDVR